MGHSIYWHVPDRVYVIQAWGDISLEEMLEISQTATEFVRSGVPPIHWIVDTRQVDNIPKNLKQIQSMTRIF